MKKIMPKVVGGIGEKKSNGGTQWYQQDRIYDSDEIALCIDGSGVGTNYVERERERVEIVATITNEGYGHEQSRRVYGTEGIAPAQTSITGGHQESKILEGLKIRRLTPLECWRLMGREDWEFERARAKNSDAQLYKQAGNSIVVNVLEHLFRELFKQYPYESK